MPGAPDINLFAGLDIPGHGPLDHHLPGTDFRLHPAFRADGQAMIIEKDGAVELPFDQKILVRGNLPLRHHGASQKSALAAGSSCIRVFRCRFAHRPFLFRRRRCDFIGTGTGRFVAGPGFLLPPHSRFRRTLLRESVRHHCLVFVERPNLTMTGREVQSPLI